jgi:hypothetical protein
MMVFAAGCGDDDKGNNSGGLTEEEQFEEISKFFNFDPNDDGEESTSEMIDLFLGTIPSQYWDGVDPGDFGAAGKRVANSSFPHADWAGVDDDSLSYSYDYDSTTGWWVVYFSVGFSGGPNSSGIFFRDSVKFEEDGGEYQREPDTNTAHVRFRQQMGLNAVGPLLDSAMNEIGFVDVSTSGRSNFDVDGLNLAEATISGRNVIDVDFDGSVEDTSVILLLGLAANVVGLTVPTDDIDGDACPTGGTIDGSMAIDLTVEQGDETASGKGAFTANIEFSGGGNATVEVESGDFSRTFSGQACEPED